MGRKTRESGIGTSEFCFFFPPRVVRLRLNGLTQFGLAAAVVAEAEHGDGKEQAKEEEEIKEEEKEVKPEINFTQNDEAPSSTTEEEQMEVKAPPPTEQPIINEDGDPEARKRVTFKFPDENDDESSSDESNIVRE